VEARLVDLRGKVALVTGASRGIGRQVALALAGQGADIALNFLKSEREAEQAAVAVRGLGPRCLAVRADVSRNDSVLEMMRTVRAELGPVQILVNNAGASRPLALQDITEEFWDEMIETNLKSAFLVTQAALPDMRERRWGRIVNISSVAAQLGGVVGPHYAASKAGLIGLTHSYASLLSKEGITVNTVAPALIATDMVRRNPNARADLIPVGRFGTAEEVAEAVLMLVGNGYITGQTINVNGGWYMS
jgi:3-oxoacyl-[acyl-carrier protein] reductase